MLILKSLPAHSIFSHLRSEPSGISWEFWEGWEGEVSLTLWPGVHVGKDGSGSEDGIALWWDVRHIGVLMAVKLKDTSVDLFLSPLSLEGHHKIVDIHIESHDSLGVVEGSSGVLRDLLSVVGNNGGMDLEIVLSLLNSHGELENLNSEGLNGDDLIGVDIDLVVVEVLGDGWEAEINIMDGHGVVLWNNGWVISSLGGGNSSKGSNSSEFHYW